MRKTFIITVLSILYLVSHAISGSIKGKIIDSQTGEDIIGAVVRVKDSKTHASLSGLDGTFTLPHINTTGTFTIVVSFVGYTPREITINDTTSPLEIAIEPQALAAETVTVTAEHKGRSDNSARMLEKTAVNVMNVISSRAIEVSPDVNVANVIQRVSGVTVERNSSGEGQYAILRGMDKRYNYTLVNGVKIPSPDNKNRYMPLDIFPAELLERLEVTKALTADMEGDAVGGAVNMVMKDAPARMQLTANVATGYSALFLGRDFVTFDRTAIGKQSPYEQYGEGYPAQVRDFNTANMVVKRERAKPDLLAGLSFGDRFFKQRFGVIAAVSFQNTYRGNNSLYFDNVNSSGDASNLPVLTKKSDREYSEQLTRVGAHLKLDYRFNDNHKLQWYNAYMDFGTTQTREITATDLSVGYDPSGGNYNLSQDSRLRWNHQSILNSTLKGDHQFGRDGNFKIDWSAVYSRAYNETPDNIYVYLGSRVNNGIPNPPSVVSSSGGSGGVKRRWEHNSDQDLAGYLNLRYKINLQHGSIDLSVGGMYRDKTRTSFYNQYNFNPYDPSKPVGQRNNLIYGIDWTMFDQIKLSLENPHGSTGDPLNYDALEHIATGYAQARLTLDKLLIVAGLRAENTNQGYTIKYPTAGVTSDSVQQYTDLLPIVHVRYNVHKDGNLRASYFRSINRPSFFEIVPYRIINEEYQERGNPNLQHATADNIDLRYEYFPRQSEQFMVGVFYKSIQNPIELGIFSEGQNTFYMPSNFGVARNFGVEVDITKYFRWFGIKANYTYTNSKITTTKVKNILNPDPTAPDRIKQIEVEQTRQLNNQAAHIANLSLLVREKGWDAQVAFSYTSDRLFAISRFENNDIWQAGYVQMDASLEKCFTEIGLTVFAKASNLLNTPMIQYIKKENPANENVQGYETYNGGTLVRRDYYGQNFQVGLRYKF